MIPEEVTCGKCYNVSRVMCPNSYHWTCPHCGLRNAPKFGAKRPEPDETKGPAPPLTLGPTLRLVRICVQNGDKELALAYLDLIDLIISP